MTLTPRLRCGRDIPVYANPDVMEFATANNQSLEVPGARSRLAEACRPAMQVLISEAARKLRCGQ